MLTHGYQKNILWKGREECKRTRNTDKTQSSALLKYLVGTTCKSHFSPGYMTILIAWSTSQTWSHSTFQCPYPTIHTAIPSSRKQAFWILMKMPSLTIFILIKKYFGKSMDQSILFQFIHHSTNYQSKLARDTFKILRLNSGRQKDMGRELTKYHMPLECFLNLVQSSEISF